MRERAADGRCKIDGRPPIKGQAERSNAVARIAQIVAPTQDRVLHLLVSESSCTDEALATDIGSPFLRRHGDDRIESPDPRAPIQRSSDDLRAVGAERRAGHLTCM